MKQHSSLQTSRIPTARPISSLANDYLQTILMKLNDTKIRVQSSLSCTHESNSTSETQRHGGMRLMRL